MDPTILTADPAPATAPARRWRLYAHLFKGM